MSTDRTPTPARTGPAEFLPLKALSLGDLCDLRDLTVEQWRVIVAETAAKAAHEINRAYCRAVGDDSQPAWDDAPLWQRDSAVNGVSLHLANPDLTPEQSHENWMAEKTAAGWVYGLEKDPEAKTHPCMVPYDQLPLEQRIKDHLFKAVVAQFA